MTERQKITVAAFVAVLKDNEVLLQLRKNTGWLDGFYDLPSGHIELGETFLQAGQRELKEEGGLKVKEDELELFHISQHEGGANGPYAYLMFRAYNWEGTPATDDPDKVAEVGFYALDSLPDNTAPYIKRALRDVETKKVTFAYFEADGLERH